MLALETIKNLGVDMSITKQDLIDLITQDLRDAADEELEEAAKVFTDASSAKEEFYKHHKKEYKKTIADNPQVVEAIRALEAVTNKRFKLARIDSYGIDTWMLVPGGYQPSVYRGPESYVVLGFPTTAPFPKEEEAELISALEVANKRYHTAKRHRENLENNSNRAKASFIRELLGASEDGKLLLTVLDAKTAKAGIRKLKNNV